jgi:hypothetical protein
LWSVAIIDDVMEWPAGAVDSSQIALPPNPDPRLSWSMSAHESAAVIRRIEVPWAYGLINMWLCGCAAPYWNDGQSPGHGSQVGRSAL